MGSEMCIRDSFSRLPDFIRDLCLRLVLAAHETGSVEFAFRARVCISRMRGNDYSDNSRLFAFVAPDGPLAAARNQAGAAREYCREEWPEADTAPGADWPPADWRPVVDALAPGCRTGAEMQRADRGGPVRTPSRFPHRSSIPDPGRGLGERHVLVGFFAAGDESAKSRRATRARRRIKKGSFEPSF